MGPAGVRVHPVDLASLPLTIPLWEELAAEPEVPVGMPSVSELLERVRARLTASEAAVAAGGTPTYRLSVALDEAGLAVGMVSLRLADGGPFAASSVVLDIVHVTTRHRRSGVGRALLGEALCFAHHADVDDIAVHVPANARSANRFYASWGFAPRTVRRGTPVASLRRRIGVEARTTPPEETADLGHLQRLLRRRALLGARVTRTARTAR